MRVLVIIVTYNGMSWIERCLKSIEKSDMPLDTYIVDNGSSDGTKEYVKKWGKCIAFVESDVNLGFGKANNLGLKYALDNDYDYAYLLNQDAWLFKSTMKALIGVHNAHPEYGILSPAQIKKDEKHFETIFGSEVCPRIKDRNLAEDLYFNQLADVYEVPDVMAAHWLISKECLKRVGGFSPIFPHYGEDDNYVNRTRYHGFKVGFVPGAKAVHDADSHPADRRKRIYLSNIYMLTTLEKVWDAYQYPYYMAFRYAVRMSIGLKSIKPLVFWVKHVFNRKEILAYRERSKAECPFLA